MTFKILFWHSNWGRISYFGIQNPILTFELGPNIVFWHSKSFFDVRTVPIIVFLHSKSYFDIRNAAIYRILTFKILFWHSNWGCLSYFDIRTEAKYCILTFKILFWHSKWGRISYFDIQNPNLTFVINLLFWPSKLGRISYHSKSYWNRVEYRILTLKILFCHSKSCWILYFDIQNPILTFKLRPNIAFWHSKSYFDIWAGQNSILTFEQGPNIVFWHSKSYFDIRNRAEYGFWTFQILFWHSNWDQISYFDIRNPTLTFELGPYMVFWHSISYFDIRMCLNKIFTSLNGAFLTVHLALVAITTKSHNWTY